MDPSRIEHIWQTLWRGQFFRGGHIHAATVAVKQWVYSPTTLNGVAVPVIMSVTVNFKME